MLSRVKRRRMARTTVKPPSPESNTPIGAARLTSTLVPPAQALVEGASDILDSHEARRALHEWCILHGCHRRLDRAFPATVADDQNGNGCVALDGPPFLHHLLDADALIAQRARDLPEHARIVADVEA